MSLAPWVTLHEERCRNGRILRLAVNHRDGVAVELDAHEWDVCRPGAIPAGAAGSPVLSPSEAAARLRPLRDAGFLVARPAALAATSPAPSVGRRLARF